MSIMHQLLFVEPAVYSLTEKATGRKYYGSSNNVYQRIVDHESRLRRGNHKNKELQTVYNSHGGNFYQVFEVLIENKPTKEDAEKIEFAMIEADQNAFNVGAFNRFERGHEIGFETRFKKGDSVKYDQKKVKDAVLEYLKGGFTYKELSEKYQIPAYVIKQYNYRYFRKQKAAHE